MIEIIIWLGITYFFVLSIVEFNAIMEEERVWKSITCEDWEGIL